MRFWGKKWHEINLMDRLIYGECLITIINGGNMYTYALGILQLVAHLIQLKRNNARASLHRSIVIGIVAELKMQISVHDRFIGFIDNQVQHMQLFRIIAVVYLGDMYFSLCRCSGRRAFSVDT